MAEIRLSGAKQPARDIIVWCQGRGIPLYGPTGASAHLRGIARALRSRGHRVRVATTLSSDARGEHDRLAAIASLHLDSRPWPKGLCSFGARVDGHRLAARALLPRPDLLWERHTLGSRAARRWASALGIERWVEINAPLSLERAWPEPPRSALLQEEVRLLRSADRLLCVSRWLQRWLIHTLDCDPTRVIYLPNGVADGRPGDRENTRRALSLHGPVLGFLGSMSPWQGADRLPALMDALGPEWTALVLGSGPVAPSPHPRILALGQVSVLQIPDLVSAFDVAVAPYRASAPPWFCPLKLLEYRAQGIPTVCAPIGDAAELLCGEGILEESEDAGAWAASIRRALQMPRRACVRSWEEVVDHAFSEQG